jgi:hypothetical protein
LKRVAAGGLLLEGRRQAFTGKTILRRGYLVAAFHLDSEVIERPRGLAGVLDEDELERRLGDGEIGIVGAAFRRLGPEQLGVELHSGINVGDVEGELDSGHDQPPLAFVSIDAFIMVDASTDVNGRGSPWPSEVL